MKTIFQGLIATVIVLPIMIIEIICKFEFAIIFSLFKPIFKKFSSLDKLEAFAYRYGFKYGYYPLTTKISDMYE